MIVPRLPKTIEKLLSIFSVMIIIGTGPITGQSEGDFDKKMIRSIRTSSNEAFRTHNLDKVLESLSSDYHMSSSSGKLYPGKESFKAVLESVFSKSPDLYFLRITEEVIINEGGNEAWEEGEWEAYRPETDDWKSYGGKYSARWVKSEDSWKIKTELFVRFN